VGGDYNHAAKHHCTGGDQRVDLTAERDNKTTCPLSSQTMSTKIIAIKWRRSQNENGEMGRLCSGTQRADLEDHRAKLMFNGIYAACVAFRLGCLRGLSSTRSTALKKLTALDFRTFQTAALVTAYRIFRCF
jgi:hypothetical protein